MLELVKKDFRITGKFNIMYIAVIAVFCAIILFIEGGGFAAVMNMMLAGLYAPLVIFLFDEKFKALVLYSSLPLKKKSIVRGRYLFTWLNIVLTALLLLIIITGFIKFFPATEGNVVEFLDTRFMIPVILIVSAMICSVYPLIYRFGMATGMVISMSIVLSALMLFFQIARFASPEKKAVIGLVIGSLKNFFTAYNHALIENLGYSGHFAVSVLIIVLMNFLSCSLSGIMLDRRSL